MFDQENAFAKWRARFEEMSPGQIEELEGHVLDCMESLPGELTSEERFLVATQRLGHPAHLQREFEKVEPWATWRAPIFWATAGVVWMLGVQAILDTGIPLGALGAAHFQLPLSWLEAWAFIVYVGGPLVAFASVGAWMRAYSTSHPATKKALFTTIAAAAVLRGALLPVDASLHAHVWKAFSPATVRSFQSVWQLAMMMGLAVTGAVAAVALVRFRDRMKKI